MFRMTVADVFFIRNRGLVATGQVEAGTVSKGDSVSVNGREVKVDGIEMFRKVLDSANAGDNIGLLLRDVTKDDVKPGDVIAAAGAALTPPPSDATWEQDFPGGLPR